MLARQITFAASMAALAAVFSGVSASAHISLERGGTHKSRYGDGHADQKEAPCGRPNGARGTNVYTYEPGETITIELSEYIPHPSYYRIAFDQDGDDDFMDPRSIRPIDPARACPFNAADKCGEQDLYNNASVLPNMDYLEPHLASEVKPKYTFEVTLPDVECDNCTLQIIQVMEDVIHGAYNPTRGDPADVPYIDDIYHQCIDLVLTRGASGTGGAGGATGGTQGTPAAPAAEDEGGCSITGRPVGVASWLLALGFVAGLIRRRARR
jgi:hypothetical protein